MVYNTTASLNKLTCTNCADFGNCQDRFGRFSWSETDSNHLVVKFKEFKRDERRHSRLVQNLTMGETYFNQFMQLRNKLLFAAENIGKE